MRIRTTFAVVALLAVAATGCGKSEAEQQADCQKALTEAATKTNRPGACKELSQDDYDTLLMAWTLRHSGVIDKDGNVDPDKLLGDE